MALCLFEMNFKGYKRCTGIILGDKHNFFLQELREAIESVSQGSLILKLDMDA
jgi:hypothetical protein